MTTRCNAIIEKLIERGNGDITSQLHFLPQVRRATVECYAGNRSYCPHDFLICGGTGGVGDWWFHSAFLPTHDVHCLDMTYFACFTTFKDYMVLIDAKFIIT